MELDEFALSRTLHYLIENFISNIKNYIEPKVLDLNKVFSEVAKRSDSLTQDLRCIAIYAHNTLETSDVLDVKELLDVKIQDLMHNLLRQDFLELTLNAEDEYIISESELHNFLHSGAMKDVTCLTPSSLQMGRSFNFDILDASSEGTVSGVDRNVNCFLSSSQFKNSRMQFEDELSELRRITENGFSTSDLNVFNVATILKYEYMEAAEKLNKDSAHLHCSPVEEHPSLSPFLGAEFDLGMLNDIADDSDSFLSWEGCLGKFLPDHLYISEVTPEAALVNISEKESQAYHSLLNPLDAISEDNLMHDVLDLLIGIPSMTFYYDAHARKFRMKSGVHLPNLSSECTARLVIKFMESGSIYYLLQKFSRDFVHASEGLVFKGLQLGIQQVLSMYKEYIVAIKVSCPSMLSLRTDVAENAELLQTFGAICGIDSKKMAFSEIPKGLGLLSYLHDVARSHKRKENGIMIAILLKYAYAPYFSFLNKFMTEGICDDPYGEFQIMEDFNYLGRRDEMYWKFAYTENIDEPTRAVPLEIKSYSQGILDCGKSIGLLKICCPEFFTLKYLFCKPPPSLSMVYSFPAAIHKLKKCVEYIILKEKAEEMYETKVSAVSTDGFYTECQKFVNRNVMLNMVQRRWNILFASERSNCNVSSFVQLRHLRACELPESVDTTLSNCKRKWSSVHTLGTQDKNSNFSGKLHKDVGLLFSSCGYIETDLKSEDIERHFTFSDFSSQLHLISYTQVLEPMSWVSACAKYKELFSVSEMDFLNSAVLDPFSKWDIKNIENSHSINKDSFDKLSPNECSKEVKDVKSVNMEANAVEDKNTVLGTFMEKLASLLVCDYGDSVEDVYSCIQVISLQRLMMHNFNAVLKMRIHLVERTIMKYVVKQLGLDSLLSSLRNVYFFQDAAFSQSLCDQLFSLVMKCKTPREFASWTVLNEILQNAISDSKQDNPILAAVNANVAFIPEEMPVTRTEFLRLFVIEFEVNWPLNIIVHQTCIQQYLKIFSTLLEIEFLCWMLSRIWRILIMTSRDLHLDDVPQFRDIMLHRFDMEQFIRIIRNSIHQHLQGPLWEFMKKNLSVEESSIDCLESIHLQYLEKALARCFLTDETCVLHELVSVMFHQIYKFCNIVFECTWEVNKETEQYETSDFKRLSTSFDTFKEYQKVFLKRITREMLTKKCGRHWDKEYQDFLETILQTEKNVS